MIQLIKEKAAVALEEGYSGLSITGELSWVLNFKGGKKEIIKYEWKLNDEIFDYLPVIALCRYNINKFDKHVIKAVIELHHYIIWNNKIHENPYYIPPEGYRENEIVEYEIKTWLENIQKYKKRESIFKEKIEEKNEILAANNEEIMAMNEELKDSYQKLDKLTNNIENIIELISRIKVGQSEEDFLSMLLNNAFALIPEADYGLIFLINNEKVKFLESIGHDLEKIKEFNINQKNIIRYYGDQAKQTYYNPVLDSENTDKKTYIEFINTLKSVSSSIFINLKVNSKVVGRISLDISNKSFSNFSDSSIRLLTSLEKLASSYLTLKRYSSLQKKFTEEIIISLTGLLEIHDEYTRGHNESVADLSRKTAEKMQLSEPYIREIYWSGLLHDIGKTIIPQYILNKKGRLTDEEYEVIKNHPKWGYETLSKSDELKGLAKNILYHHERWDGRGYPEGLQEEEIPLASQILSAADAWDAMRSRRSYRKPLSREKALKEIKDNRGKQFSPKVVDAFLQIIEND